MSFLLFISMPSMENKGLFKPKITLIVSILRKVSISI